MNDKISRFSSQLGGAAPMPPELEFRPVPEPRSPLTAVRVGIALAGIATLAAVGVLATRDSNDRQSVAPAAASTGSIGDAVSAALPAGFALQYVERGGNPSVAHAVAVNTQFDVLDIEIVATGEGLPADTNPDSTVLPPDITPTPSCATEWPNCNDVLVGANPPSTEAPADVTPISTHPPVDCQNIDSPETDPLCVLDANGEYTYATTAPEPSASTGCIVYAPSTDEVPPTLPTDCTVVVDPTLPAMTVPAFTNDMAVPDGVQTADGEIISSTHYFDTNDGGVPAPFSGASAQSDSAFVGVALYGINRPVDTATFANDVLQNVSAIDDLVATIAALPMADPTIATQPTPVAPLDGTWTGQGASIGSLLVTLSSRVEDGSVIVQVSFPGNHTGSGNDGSVFWHATTGADGRTYIAQFQRGSNDHMSDADAAAFTQKIAEKSWSDVAATIEAAGSIPVTTIEVVDESAVTSSSITETTARSTSP